MTQAIDDAKTDFVSMARPLILEPDLPNRFLSGAADKAKCDNCNKCYVAADTVGIRCHLRDVLDNNRRE